MVLFSIMEGEGFNEPYQEPITPRDTQTQDEIPNIFFSDFPIEKEENSSKMKIESFIHVATENVSDDESQEIIIEQKTLPVKVEPVQDVMTALSIANNFLKKQRMPSSSTSFSFNPDDVRTVQQIPFLLAAPQTPTPNFEFLHTGNLRAKGPTYVIHQLLRRVMDKQDLYINWARLENITAVTSMVVLVLNDVNGIEIYNRIVDYRLSTLKNVNNKEHSVVFDLPKQDEKIKFWSKIFDCPRLDKFAVVSPNSFKGEFYLLSPEDLKLLDYPSELNPETTFYTQTDLWPAVAKTDFNRIIAIDCEMVITKVGYQVARITLVDEGFQVLYDELVLPMDEVTDWVTE